MGEQSLTYFAYVCFMPRNDGVFLPYCCAYHELCVRTLSVSLVSHPRSLVGQTAGAHLRANDPGDPGLSRSRGRLALKRIRRLSPEPAAGAGGEQAPKPSAAFAQMACGGGRGLVVAPSHSAGAQLATERPN